MEKGPKHGAKVIRRIGCYCGTAVNEQRLATVRVWNARHRNFRAASLTDSPSAAASLSAWGPERSVPVVGATRFSILGHASIIDDRGGLGKRRSITLSCPCLMVQIALVREALSKGVRPNTARKLGCSRSPARFHPTVSINTDKLNIRLPGSTLPQLTQEASNGRS